MTTYHGRPLTSVLIRQRYSPKYSQYHQLYSTQEQDGYHHGGPTQRAYAEHQLVNQNDQGHDGAKSGYRQTKIRREANREMGKRSDDVQRGVDALA